MILDLSKLKGKSDTIGRTIMNMDYQTLLKGIFICGLPSVNQVIKKENASVVIDLRAEAQQDSYYENVIYRNFPLIDGGKKQQHILHNAISEITQFHKEGKQVVLH